MKKSNTAKTIEFTEKQFETLLKLAYLGNWIANANRDNKPLKEYDEMENYLFSQAEKFGLKKCVDREDEDHERSSPSAHFEEKSGVRNLLDEYDDSMFWDELIDRLAMRDFHKKYREIQIDEMNEDEYWMNTAKCEEKWAEEISRFGLRRLGVSKE